MEAASGTVSCRFVASLGSQVCAACFILLGKCGRHTVLHESITTMIGVNCADVPKQHGNWSWLKLPNKMHGTHRFRLLPCAFTPQSSGTGDSFCVLGGHSYLASTAAATAASCKMAPEPLLPEETAAQVGQRGMQAISGALACMCINIGHKLGLFSHLKRLGPCTSADLAATAGLSERWVREWLYQQSAAGFVSCDQRASSFWLSNGQAAVLVEDPEQPRTTPLGKCKNANCF